MKIAETMCPVSTRAVSTHACLGHRGSARPPCQHVIGDQVLPGCSWGSARSGWGQRWRSGRPGEDHPNGWQKWSGYVQNHHEAVPSTPRQRGQPWGQHVRAYTWRRNEAERDRFRRRNCTPAPGNQARSSRTKRARPGPTGTRARRARRAWRPAPARARPPTAAPTRPYLRAQFEEMTKLAISILSMGSGVCTLGVDLQQ